MWMNNYSYISHLFLSTESSIEDEKSTRVRWTLLSIKPRKQKKVKSRHIRAYALKQEDCMQMYADAKKDCRSATAKEHRIQPSLKAHEESMLYEERIVS
ncbi:hypothetical protein V6N13_017351 [Hibiscus sabdariffa]|uniref:Uncharacterized protein n=1 Tax=Hibiscus sabdariffa TaxID=183260 RepID=A0ABR2CZ26_9ROSI